MLGGEWSGIVMRAKRAKRERRKDRAAPSMDAILKYPSAKASFARLVSEGVPSEALETLLHNAAIVERRGGEDESITPEGIPLYTIKRFAKSLEGIASTIERIETHYLWKLEGGLVPLTGDQATRDAIARLPELLREYAFILTVKARVNPTTQGMIERIVPYTFRDLLVENVEKLTGTPHYGEVAVLLTATLQADGQDTIVTPESLRAYRSRHPETESDDPPSPDV